MTDRLDGVVIFLVWAAITPFIVALWKISRYWWQHPVNAALTGAWLLMGVAAVRWVWQGEP